MFTSPAMLSLNARVYIHVQRALVVESLELLHTSPVIFILTKAFYVNTHTLGFER